jgi:hypothetical protein
MFYYLLDSHCSGNVRIATLGSSLADYAPLMPQSSLCRKV